MSYVNVGLGRLLRVLYSDTAQRVSLLREDIRAEIRVRDGLADGDGGDFHVLFWADAKRHIAGELDLVQATTTRIAAHRGRARLYPLLQRGFLFWWNERRRARNVPFSVISDNVRARHTVENLGLIRVENTLSITVGEDEHRIIYPYFFENPTLSEEGARVGLWVMMQCVQGYRNESMTILDIIRNRAFSLIDAPLKGNEEAILIERYRALLEQRSVLREDYD